MYSTGYDEASGAMSYDGWVQGRGGEARLASHGHSRSFGSPGGAVGQGRVGSDSTLPSVRSLYPEISEADLSVYIWSFWSIWSSSWILVYGLNGHLGSLWSIWGSPNDPF